MGINLTGYKDNASLLNVNTKAKLRTISVELVVFFLKSNELYLVYLLNIDNSILIVTRGWFIVK